MNEQRTPCEQAYIVFSDGKPTWEMDSREIWDAAYQAGEKAWKDAVIDQLVILHIYQAKHDADPKLALKDVIDYHVQIALDPQVSSDAAALVQQGRDAMREEAVKVCDESEYPDGSDLARWIGELK